MREKGKTIPKEWVTCPLCDRDYSFIRCRVTDRDGKNHCLSCPELEKPANPLLTKVANEEG